MAGRFIVARCPNPDCGCAVMYSGNPKDKNRIRLASVPSDYDGITQMCPRCKMVYRVVEKAEAVIKNHFIPVIGSIQV